MTKIFGIKNCDSVKKARNWLKAHAIDHDFIDLRADGIDRETIEKWIDVTGWETLVNKRSTTWKNLDPETREKLDANNVIPTLIANPTLVKRPVVETGKGILVGFNEATYSKSFNK